jgi:hypothetical protein
MENNEKKGSKNNSNQGEIHNSTLNIHKEKISKDLGNSKSAESTLLTDEQIEKDETLNTCKILDQSQSRKIGNMHVFMYDKFGEPLIVIGPHCTLTLK